MKKNKKPVNETISWMARKIMWLSFLYAFIACLAPFFLIAILLGFLDRPFIDGVLLFFTMIISSFVVLGFSYLIGKSMECYKELIDYDQPKQT